MARSTGIAAVSHNSMGAPPGVKTTKRDR